MIWKYENIKPNLCLDKISKNIIESTPGHKKKNPLSITILVYSYALYSGVTWDAASELLYNYTDDKDISHPGV